MSLATAELPSDPDALRAFAAALQAELYAKTLHIEKLKAQLAALRRARFGQSSEKLDRQIDLLELIIADLEEVEATGDARREATAAAPEAVPVPSSTRRLGNRRPLPDHLPREIVTHAGVCACPACGSLLWEIYIDMEPEDGCLWVYGPDEQQIPAFTDFGLESLADFIREHKANRDGGQNRCQQEPGS